MSIKQLMRIAVIGPSMSGKTTFISSLLSDSIRDEMTKVSLANTEGQTKISVHYELDPSISDNVIRVNSVVFKSVDCCCERDVPSTRLQELFGVKESSIQYDEQCTGRLYEVKINGCTLDVNKFCSIVNTPGSIDGLAYLHVSVRPSDAISTKLEDIDYRVALVDTRGLMDEDDLTDLSKAPFWVNIELQDAGLFDVDSCVYFHQSGVGMTRVLKDRYSSILKKLTELKPVFYVAHSGMLNTWMTNNKGKELSMSIIDSIIDDDYSATDVFNGLPESVLLPLIESQAMKASRIKGCRLLLSNFRSSAKNFVDEQLPMYLTSVCFAFGELIERTAEFRTIVKNTLPTIANAMNTTNAIKKIISTTEEFREIVSNKFSFIYDNICNKYGEAIITNFLVMPCRCYSLGYNYGLVRPVDCVKEALAVSKYLTSSCANVIIDIIDSGLLVKHMCAEEIVKVNTDEDMTILNMYLADKLHWAMYYYSSIPSYCIIPKFMSEAKDEFMCIYFRTHTEEELKWPNKTKTVFEEFYLYLMSKALLEILSVYADK